MLLKTTSSLEAVPTIGIDIGKNTFHLIGLDKMGRHRSAPEVVAQPGRHSARQHAALPGPTPGVVIKRRHTSSSRTLASKRRYRMTICSRSTSWTTSIGSISTAKLGKFSTSSLMRAPQTSPCRSFRP